MEIQDIDLIRDTENKIKFVGTTANDQKMGFPRSCGDFELTKLLEKEARIRLKPVEVNGEREEAQT